MRLNQLKSEEVLAAAEAFEKSIKDEAVCAAASEFHGGDACRVFGRAKGSFNLCYFVAFDAFDASGATQNSTTPPPPAPSQADRWVVRVPIIPRLGCPDEKHRCEIATMKYLLERSDIPIPKLYGYSLTNCNPIGSPFMIIEYIDASPLSIRDLRNRDFQKHIMTQLAALYDQFRQLTFEHIGSLTLGDVPEYDESREIDVDLAAEVNHVPDPDHARQGAKADTLSVPLPQHDDRRCNEPWVFRDQRPLQNSISDQTLAGLNPSAVMPPNRIYTSTVDYFFALTRLAFNDWVQARDSVRSEEDARQDLYDLYNFRSCVMEWADPESNYGPFYLAHGDLLPSNILVDSERNFVAIIDWEWCRTFPAQLLVPPAWITGYDITQVGHGYGFIPLAAGIGNMLVQAMKYCEKTHELSFSHPLMKLWKNTLYEDPFLMAHALLRPDKIIPVYAPGLDCRRYGYGTRESRVSQFYFSFGERKKLALVRQKVADWESFKKEVTELGKELKERPDPVNVEPSPELRKMFEGDDNLVDRFATFFHNHARHFAIGFAAVTLCAMFGRVPFSGSGQLFGRYLTAAWGKLRTSNR